MEKEVVISYLEYKSVKVGYRVRLRYNNEYKYYDVGLGVGNKEGLDKLVEGGVITLHLRGDMLVSIQEVKEDIDVENITENILLIRDLKRLTKVGREKVKGVSKVEKKESITEEEKLKMQIRARVWSKRKEEILCKDIKETIEKELIGLGYYELEGGKVIEDLVEYIKEEGGKEGYSYISIGKKVKENQCKDMLIKSKNSKRTARRCK